MKFFSSIRVTRTEVVNPFFGNVAAVVAPIVRLAVVSVFPPAISALAFVGSDEALALGVGSANEVGLLDGLAVGVGEGVEIGRAHV